MKIALLKADANLVKMVVQGCPPPPPPPPWVGVLDRLEVMRKGRMFGFSVYIYKLERESESEKRRKGIFTFVIVCFVFPEEWKFSIGDLLV